MPVPGLNVGASIPINSQISVTYPPGYNVTFNWTFVPGSLSANNLNALGRLSKSASGVVSAVGSTVGLGSLPLSPGTYAIQVYAQDGYGNTSDPASAQVTLVLADLNSVKVYPNPWRKDKHAGTNVTFANLPTGSTVKIFTVSGREVASLSESGQQVVWDLTNKSGEKAASGLYLYLITDGQGNKTKGKLAVIR